MYLETVTGKLIDIANPEANDISAQDIAWGLSRIPRFAGHTITAVPYNVAQHSLFVMNELVSLLDFSSDVSDVKVQDALETLRGLYPDTKDPFYYRLRLKALLHDAAEVYIGDIPSPVKKHPALYPAIKKIESNLMEAIYKHFDLSCDSPSQAILIKHCDLVARAIEAHAFMPSRGRGWEGMPEVSLVKLQSFDAPMTSVEAYEEFMGTIEWLVESER